MATRRRVSSTRATPTPTTTSSSSLTISTSPPTKSLSPRASRVAFLFIHPSFRLRWTRSLSLPWRPPWLPSVDSVSSTPISLLSSKPPWFAPSSLAESLSFPPLRSSLPRTAFLPSTTSTLPPRTSSSLSPALRVRSSSATCRNRIG